MIAMDATTATLVIGGAIATVGAEQTTMTEGSLFARRGVAARAMERQSQDIVHRATGESVIAIRAQKELDPHVVRVAASHPDQEHVLMTIAARAAASRLADRAAEVQPGERQDGLPLPAT